MDCTLEPRDIGTGGVEQDQVKLKLQALADATLQQHF